MLSAGSIYSVNIFASTIAFSGWMVAENQLNSLDRMTFSSKCQKLSWEWDRCDFNFWLASRRWVKIQSYLPYEVAILEETVSRKKNKWDLGKCPEQLIVSSYFLRKSNYTIQIWPVFAQLAQLIVQQFDLSALCLVNGSIQNIILAFQDHIFRRYT